MLIILTWLPINMARKFSISDLKLRYQIIYWFVLVNIVIFIWGIHPLGGLIFGGDLTGFGIDFGEPSYISREGSNLSDGFASSQSNP